MWGLEKGDSSQPVLGSPANYLLECGVKERVLSYIELAVSLLDENREPISETLTSWPGDLSAKVGRAV